MTKRKLNAPTTAQGCFLFMWNELESGRCLFPNGNADINALENAAASVVIKYGRPTYYSFTGKISKIVFLMWQHVHIGVPLDETTFKIGG